MSANFDLTKQARFFTLSLDLLCVAGFDGYFKHLNPAWAQTTGFTLEELKAKPFIEFVHPDDHQATVAETAKLVTGRGETIYFENRYICKNGSIKWLLWNATSFPAEELIYAIARDVTRYKQTEQALQYRVEFEKLITALSTDFINLTPDEIDNGINQALQTIAQLAGVDRSYIFILAEDGHSMDNTHEWCAEGIEPQIQKLQGLALADFPWFAQKIKNLEIIHVPRVADLPDEARLAQAKLQALGIQSIINIPMLHRGSLVGFFGFDTLKTEKAWGTEEINLLKVVAEMLVNALERKQVEQREALAYEFGRQLTTLLDPDILLSEIVHRLQKVFGYYHAHVYLFNKTFPQSAHPFGEDEALLVMREGTGQAGLEMKRQGHAIPLQATQSLVARAARALEPVIVNNVSQDPHHLPNVLLPDTRSEAAIPLFLGQRLIGVLDVQHSLVDHFDPEEIRTLQIVANQLSIALSNARLFEENAQRLAIIENASNLIALISLEERLVIYINQAGAQLTGHNAPEEMIGQPLAHFYPPEALKRVEKEGLFVAAEQGIWRGESCLRRLNGDDPVPVDQTIFLICDEHDQPQTWATIMTDITERKRAEEALQKINEELEARVAARTAELSQTNADLVHEIAERKQIEAALIRQTQELARSNAELEQFAYVSSHDLQEPLRMVTSYVQLLARRYRGQLDNDADEFIAYAVDGASRMQQLINDLLAYSRVGTRGKDFAPTDCQATLEYTLRNLQPVIQECGATITRDALPTVMADSLQLAQLFQNLIGNALKFRSQEPPRIHISAEKNHHGAADEWLFSVADNGIGLEPEYAERIFIIFQRLHNREEYSGTGIGLAVCKKIVERHHGRIWVESQAGAGATFYFTLPAMKGQ
ncbi:MAG: PAS domain S-box protein [Anaerolineae bacterium]|nr:PAS domain S-box protein [Anaerolineae bacterium]